MAIKMLNGTAIDTSVANVEVRDVWSSELEKRLGHPADMVNVILRTEALRSDETRYPFVFGVYEHKKTKGAVAKLTKALKKEFAQFVA